MGAHFSTWWTEGRRINVEGSFGSIQLLPLRSSMDVDDVLSKVVESLFQCGNHNPGDLHYLIFGHGVGIDLDQPHVEIKVEVLQAVERALLEYVDLGKGHILVHAQKKLRGQLDLITQLRNEGRGEVIELPSGIIIFHRVVPAEVRLRARKRADQRARVVDEAVAAHALRRAARNSAPEAA